MHVTPRWTLARLINSNLAIVAIGLLGLVLVTAGCTDGTQNSASARPYILSTATTGGTFYPVGVAIATITKSKLYDEQGISLSAISSAGSLENIRLLRDNQAQFGILQGVFAAWAWNGDGPFSRPQTYVRSVAALWPNTEHFVLSRELVRTGSINDLDSLDGQRFVLGARNSGAERTGDYILESLGIDYRERMTLAYMGYGATANAIADGTIVGMNIPAGPPVSGITRAFATDGEDLRLLEFSDVDLERVNERYPLWRRSVLPANTYPNQTAAVQTIAHANVLAVRSDVPDDVVYAITQTLWENLATLNQIHGATRAMSLDTALTGVGAPLHPGAARFYRERGIEIPALLTPP